MARPRCQQDTSIAEIKDLWEDGYETGWVEVHWLYWPEETAPGRLPHHHERELLLVEDHTDEVSAGSLLRPVEVVSETLFRNRLGNGDGGPECYFVRSIYDYMTRQTRPLLSGADKGIAIGRHVAGGAAGASAVQGRRSTRTDPRGASPAAAAAVVVGAARGVSAAAAVTRGEESGSFQELCAQASASLQLSARPPKLPCREKEREKVRADDRLPRGVCLSVQAGPYSLRHPRASDYSLPRDSHQQGGVRLLALHTRHARCAHRGSPGYWFTAARTCRTRRHWQDEPHS